MLYIPPAVADGIIVLGCRDRQVHAIDAKTGKRASAFKTRGEVDATAAISNGRVFIPSKDKKLYVLDLKTRAQLFEFTAGRPVTASPSIASGVLVIGHTAAYECCLRS